MEIVDPRIDPSLVREGSKATIIAKEQNEYRDLPAIRTPLGQVISRWSPTADERRRILAGEDLFLTVLAPKSLQPVLLTVGPIDWKPCPFCGAGEKEPHDMDNCPYVTE